MGLLFRMSLSRNSVSVGGQGLSETPTDNYWTLSGQPFNDAGSYPLPSPQYPHQAHHRASHQPLHQPSQQPSHLSNQMPNQMPNQQAIQQANQSATPSATPSPHPIQSNTVTPVTQPNPSRRGVNFSPQEDTQLCRSWLNVSQDSLVGNGQTGTTFWVRVLADFKHHMGPHYTERTHESLSSRFQPMNRSISKYCGCVAKVKSYLASGKTTRDVHSDARIMYQKLEKHAFKYMECYDILSPAPKWAEHNGELAARRTRSSTPSRSATPSLSTSSSHSSTSIKLLTPSTSEIDSDLEIVSGGRPIGTKAAKRARLADSHHADLVENTRIIAESSVSMARDSKLTSAALVMLSNDQILSRDTSSFDPELKLLYQIQKTQLKNKIMAELQASNASLSDEVSNSASR